MIACRFDQKGNWPPYFSDACFQFDGKDPDHEMDDIPELIDLVIMDELNKRLILCEYKDTDLHSSLYPKNGGTNIRSEFARMVSVYTKYALKGWHVELYCLFMQPQWNGNLGDITPMLEYMNDERTLLSICADYNIKPKVYGKKESAAEFPFKRITEPWFVSLDKPIKEQLHHDIPLLAEILCDLPGVSGENAAKWSLLYNHNLSNFLYAWSGHFNTYEFKEKMRLIFPRNKDGTDCKQYSDLYALFYNDEEG